jgi:hypothetical protein
MGEGERRVHRLTVSALCLRVDRVDNGALFIDKHGCIHVTKNMTAASGGSSFVTERTSTLKCLTRAVWPSVCCPVEARDALPFRIGVNPRCGSTRAGGECRSSPPDLALLCRAGERGQPPSGPYSSACGGARGCGVARRRRPKRRPWRCGADTNGSRPGPRGCGNGQSFASTERREALASHAHRKQVRQEATGPQIALEKSSYGVTATAFHELSTHLPEAGGLPHCDEAEEELGWSSSSSAPHSERGWRFFHPLRRVARPCHVWEQQWRRIEREGLVQTAAISWWGGSRPPAGPPLSASPTLQKQGLGNEGIRQQRKRDLYDHPGIETLVLTSPSPDFTPSRRMTSRGGERGKSQCNVIPFHPQAKICPHYCKEVHIEQKDSGSEEIPNPTVHGSPQASNRNW